MMLTSGYYYWRDCPTIRPCAWCKRAEEFVGKVPSPTATMPNMYYESGAYGDARA